ncbi:MAG: hypothetical protein ACLUOI_25310 [Eisenbergiella sp.]
MERVKVHCSYWHICAGCGCFRVRAYVDPDDILAGIEVQGICAARQFR